MTWLGYREEEVWQLTPRKYMALVNKYVELENQKWGAEKKTNVVDGFVDQIPGW